MVDPAATWLRAWRCASRRFESLICAADSDQLPDGNIVTPFPPPEEGALWVGWTRAGAATCSLPRAGANGALRRVYASDPSWRNWPVLEHAIIGNIVPDFPLINKSFNLSYSGHDL